MSSSSAGGAVRWRGGAGGGGQRPVEEPEVWLSAAALLPPPQTHDQSSSGGGGQVHLHRCVFLPVVCVSTCRVFVPPPVCLWPAGPDVLLHQRCRLQRLARERALVRAFAAVLLVILGTDGGPPVVPGMTTEWRCRCVSSVSVCLEVMVG